MVLNRDETLQKAKDVEKFLDCELQRRKKNLRTMRGM